MRTKLGQHFLNNPLVAEKIVELLSPEKDENIFEIGPGRGFLTSFLKECGGRLTAVEIDGELARFLREKYSSYKIKIINGDILHTPVEKFAPHKICGNLPYQICGKILEKILLTDFKWKKAVFMLPLATARRAAAAPGDSSYSRLTVLCSCVAKTRLEFKVGKENFSPPPKIESAVVSMVKKNPPPGQNFICSLKACFSSRRKKLKNSISRFFSIPSSLAAEIVRECGIDPGRRAQELELKDFYALNTEFVKRKLF